MCAQMVLKDYKFLKIADVNLVSQMAIRGEFGQFYESISIPKVLEFFSDYFNLRCEVGQVYAQKHNETGQTESNASNTVKQLIEIGIIDQSLIDAIGKDTKDKDEEFRKVNADYHAKKISQDE